MSDASALIDRFVAAWPRQDLDELLGFFADDAVYENVPIDPPNRGKEEIRKTFEQFSGMAESIEFVVHQQSASGNVVMNERTDRFLINGKWLDLRVMGVFEVEGDKITAWRDYFDMTQFSQGLADATGQTG